MGERVGIHDTLLALERVGRTRPLPPVTCLRGTTPPTKASGASVIIQLNMLEPHQRNILNAVVNDN